MKPRSQALVWEKGMKSFLLSHSLLQEEGSTAAPEDPACAKPLSQYVGDEIHCSDVGMGQGLLNNG